MFLMGTQQVKLFPINPKGGVTSMEVGLHTSKEICTHLILAENKITRFKHHNVTWLEVTLF